MNHPSAPRAHERLRAMPLRWRLVAVVVVLMLAAIVLTSGVTTALLRGYLMNRTDGELRQAAVPVAQAAFDQVLNRRSSLDPFAPPNTYVVRIMPTGSGKAIDLTTPTSDTDRPDIPDLTVKDSRVRTGDPFTVGSSHGSGRWRVVAGATHDGSATFAVAVSLATVDSTVRRLRLLTTVIGLAVTAACAVIGWFAVRRAFRPLHEIEDTAAAIAGGDLTQRIPVRTAPDEVTSLSDSLNVMLGRIEHSFAVREASEDRMRQFVGDASHELRTPLATVRGYAELFRQGAVSDPEDVAGAMRRIEDEATRMGGLVEDLLLLTRLDTPREMELGTVDLTVLAADAVQDAKALDQSRPLRLLPLSDQLEATFVAGDEERLRQVVTNLLANAINHTPDGSPIELAVGVRPDTSTAVLEVRDHGHGVPPEDAARVFERFYRSDPSRARGHGGGNGLGLAIVAAIVKSHEGRVGLAPTAGGGATFVVELPPADSQTSPSHRAG